MARYRGTTAQRGLGHAHQADKKRLLAQHRDGDPCWRCGQPMYKWQKLDRDHVIDRALGGTTGPAVLAHATCNRSAGAQLSNQIRPQRTTPNATQGRDTICRICGKRYWYAARPCEICGGHYHPHDRTQRTCSRTCGAIIARRNKMAKGWIPPDQRPKPVPKPRPVAEPYAPRYTVTYYTCRYCGQLGVSSAKGQQREVCPDRACQMMRLSANNWRVRYGITQAEADAAVTGVTGRPATPPPAADHVASSQPRSALHRCPVCGEPTTQFRWCDGCLCTSVNAKGKRCGNVASTGGKCDYHAGEQMASSRQW